MTVKVESDEQTYLLEQNADGENSIKAEKDNSYDRKVFQFYIFICLSTALRAFEAGIVSSMMSEIQADLNLDYTEEGTITASPDYGIAPGAFFAIFLFRQYSSKTILVFVLSGAALAAVMCAIQPSKASLIVARAMGGLLWANAATHYPVWIDRRGPPTRKTLWLACTNISLLVGVIAGYLVGGTTRVLSSSSSSIIHFTWVEWYFVSGLLMAVCALIAFFCFDSDLMDIHNPQSTSETKKLSDVSSNIENGSYKVPATEKQENDSLLKIIGHLFSSSPFVLAVAITGCISGGIVFALYFGAQVGEARGINKSTTFLLVMTIFVTAPPPGVFFGSWVVHKLGGYTDHVSTFRLALGSAIVVLASAIALQLSWTIWGEDQKGQIPFIAAFWIFAFAGAMAGPPMNGIAVSAVPHASHVASAIQFALANAAKIVIPQIGGFICSNIGLIDGFHLTIVVSAILFVVLSWAGLIHAKETRLLQAATDC